MVKERRRHTEACGSNSNALYLSPLVVRRLVPTVPSGRNMGVAIVDLEGSASTLGPVHMVLQQIKS